MRTSFLWNYNNTSTTFFLFFVFGRQDLTEDCDALIRRQMLKQMPPEKKREFYSVQTLLASSCVQEHRLMERGVEQLAQLLLFVGRLPCAE